MDVEVEMDGLVETINEAEYEAAYYHQISQQRSAVAAMEPGEYLRISHSGLMCRAAPRKSCSIHTMLSRLNSKNKDRVWHSKHTAGKDSVLVACYKGEI